MTTQIPSSMKISFHFFWNMFDRSYLFLQQQLISKETTGLILNESRTKLEMNKLLKFFVNTINRKSYRAKSHIFLSTIFLVCS